MDENLVAELVEDAKFILENHTFDDLLVGVVAQLVAGAFLDDHPEIIPTVAAFAEIADALAAEGIVQEIIEKARA